MLLHGDSEDLSESSLGTRGILQVLSCSGSNIKYLTSRDYGTFCPP